MSEEQEYSDAIVENCVGSHGVGASSLISPAPAAASPMMAVAGAKRLAGPPSRWRPCNIAAGITDPITAGTIAGITARAQRCSVGLPQAPLSVAPSPTARHKPMMRSRTVHSDTVRTIPHPGPIWDMTAIGIRAREASCGAADNRPRPAFACGSPPGRLRTPAIWLSPNARRPADRSLARSSSSAVDFAGRPAPSRPCLPNRSRR